MKAFVLISFSLITLMLTAVQSLSQPPDTLWTRTFGGQYLDYGYGVQQTNDGGFIVVGSKSLLSDLNFDAYLVKFDSNGTQEWERNYGNLNGRDEGLSLQQTDDGGYIIGGFTTISEPYPSHRDVWLIKTNSSGDTIWTKTYGQGLYSNEICECVRQTSDGGYILCGKVQWSLPPYPTDALLIKTDASGNLQWQHTYGDSIITEYGHNVLQTDDGGYIFLGDIYDSTGTSDISLTKTNSVGDSLWTKTYGGNLSDRNTDFAPTWSDGGYIITGYTFSYASGSGDDVWLIKTDSAGDTLWTRTYGGADSVDWGCGVQQTDDGGFVIAATTASYGAGIWDLWIIKTNANGDTIWTKVMGDSGYDAAAWGESVQQTTDGGYIIVGHTDLGFGNYNHDVWLVRLESDTAQGFTTLQDHEIPKVFALYPPSPNPFNPSTLIKYQLPSARKVNLRVYNTDGQLITTLVNEWRTAGNHEVTFDGADLPSGVYLYRIRAGSWSASEKMILLK